MDYHYYASLSTQIPEIPPDSILSRTFFQDDQIKAILFGFATGQELSEHTASVPAIIQILEGHARLTLGKDEMDAEPGTWVHMPANLAHSIYAITPVKMLLLMMR